VLVMDREAGELPGRWLRGARAEQGLSQEELATRSGLSVRTISNVERGRTRPHPRSVRVLMDTLGLPQASADELVALYRTRQGSEPGACLPQAEPSAGSAVRDARGQTPGTAGDAAMVPRQLPAVVAHFVGRSAELKILDGLLEPAPGSPGLAGLAGGVAAISGTAGIGKSSLAVHWARQAADRFPDGQLYANLRGFDPAGSPAAPGEVIRAFLGSLGVTASQLPLEAEAQAGLYRSLLTGRRMLIVLDNARDAAQVRPLLPGAPGCLVVVTSRSQLAGLATTHGARLVHLGMLTADEAAELLARRLGEYRVVREPEAAGELAGLCGGLPLALAIIAARAAARPQFRLAALAARLRDEHGKLDALDADGEAASSIRAVFSWSYQSLPAPAAALFRMLGLHPGPDISVPAAASLAGLDMAQAGKILAQLAGACLIGEHAPSRYDLHDLLRAYAAEQARTLDPAAFRRAAIGRVLDHYLHTAAAADRLLNPQRDPVSPDLPQPGTAPAGFADYAEATAWFDAEREVLLAAVSLAAREGFDTHAWQLPWALAGYLDRQAHWHDWKTAQQTAVDAAGRTGDQAAQAHARRGLGHVFAVQRHYQDAHDQLAQALSLYCGLGDQLGQARTHHDIAWCYGKQGCHQQALYHGQQSLRLARMVGHRVAEAVALNAVGWHSAHLGNHQLALASCQEALDVAQEFGTPFEQANAQDSLGYAHHRAEDYAQAATSYRQALSTYRDLDDRYHQARTLARLGDAYHAAGQPQAALTRRQEALAILDDLRHPDVIHVRSVLRERRASVNFDD
jgi:tetratricopeptide (TPR) repeat protein/transcriptional regulator with XRE-family HTH domain